MKYCNNCKQLVDPKKDISVGLLVFLILCCTIPGIIYYIVKSKTCPVCNSTNWGVPPQEGVKPSIPETKIEYCPQCGSPVSGKFCDKCGVKLE